MKLLCPSCGISNEEVRFSGPFCVKCKPVHIDVPKRAEYQRCTRCGKMRFKGSWTDWNESKVEDDIAAKCKGEFLRATYSLADQEGTFFVGDKKEMYPLKIQFPADIIKVICQQCSRQSSGYFEAIIQLRGKQSSIKRYVRLFKKILAKTTFLSKEEEKKEGTDLYVGSSREVVALLSELGMRAQISRKLSGQREGKRLYRTTFLLRFNS